MTVSEPQIRDRLLQLVRDRGPEKTICPSEVARSLSPDDWRSLMSPIRAVGIKLAAAEMIVVMQKGQIVDPQMAKGPIRYRLNRQRSDRGPQP